MHSKSKLFSYLPYSWKVKILHWMQLVGLHTAKARLLPVFLIIGAQRSGTSSLYADLIQHPDVRSALRKEIHYFSVHYDQGIDWYRSHFPLSIQKILKPRLITGEASPDYLLYPLSARRVFQMNPSIKLIALLRNPVDRAYSHYHHEVRLRTETASFEEAIDLEELRLHGKLSNGLDRGDSGFNFQHFSYLTRGRYLEQLKNWDAFFRPRQLLVLQSETFFAHPDECYRQVLSYLSLSAWTPKAYHRLHGAPYPNMHSRTIDRLTAYFEPYNQELYQFLGQDLGWENRKIAPPHE